MDYADIRLLSGEQGAGKSSTSVALPVDDYYEKLTGVVSSYGEYVKARSLNEDEESELESQGIAYDQFKHVRIFSDDGKESKVVSIPSNFMVVSPVKIFANFTLYGIRYVPIDGARIIEYMNTDLMRDAWVILDESIIVDKQDTMTREGKMTQKFGAQVAKRDVRLIINSQYLNMVQGRYALFATTRVECSYDSNTHRITLDVNKNSPEMVSTSYYAPPYWRFYKRKEVIKVPQGKIDKALEAMQVA